jgi:predicted RNase H-like HicB family nuclease
VDTSAIFINNIRQYTIATSEHYEDFFRNSNIPSARIDNMKIKVVVHEAEEGGFWAEVPAIPGCATQGETFEELLQNLYEAIEGCLSVDVSQIHTTNHDRIVELAV